MSNSRARRNAATLDRGVPEMRELHRLQLEHASLSLADATKRQSDANHLDDQVAKLAARLKDVQVKGLRWLFAAYHGEHRHGWHGGVLGDGMPPVFAEQRITGW